jgi:hypothetical protein
MSWGSDSTYTGGPALGASVKVEPSDAERSQGLVAGEPVLVQHLNYVLNALDSANGYFRRESLTTDRTIAGSETLNNDLYVDVLTVPAGTTLDTDGWRIFADTVIIEATGVVHNDGNAGGNVAPGNSPDDGGLGGGENYLGGGGTGATGAVAANTAGNQATAVTGRAGGAGGAGGGTGLGEAGGIAQTATTIPLAAGEWRVYPHAVTQRIFELAGTIRPIRGGVGGSSGACDGAGGGQAGGGGGGGGGIVVICCRRLVNAGTIRANGGAGGPGFTTVGNAHGGGGGGGGGVVVLAYHEGTVGTVTVTGGAGGAAGGSGVAGSAGSDGSITELRI